MSSTKTELQPTSGCQVKPLAPKAMKQRRAETRCGAREGVHFGGHVYIVFYYIYICMSCMCLYKYIYTHCISLYYIVLTWIRLFDSDEHMYLSINLIWQWNPPILKGLSMDVDLAGTGATTPFSCPTSTMLNQKDVRVGISLPRPRGSHHMSCWYQYSGLYNFYPHDVSD